MKDNVLFDFGDWEITKRELIASITIIAILLIIGLLISNAISNSIADKNLEYDQALQITDQDLLEHGMNTDVGNAFVYGDLQAVDTVTYDEIGGQYMYVKKIKERYTRHTRTVEKTRTNSKGEEETYEVEEEYWTWDEVDREHKQCEKISFLGHEFEYAKIQIPSAKYIDTIYDKKFFGDDIRYKYYGCVTKYTGTIYADLRNGTIPNGTSFHNNSDIQQTIDYLEADEGIVMFWVFWIVLIIVIVVVFYYIDNRWLE